MSGLTKDDIIRRFLNLHPDTLIDMTEYALPLLMVRQLVEATAAAEREACAKLCDALKNPIDDPLAPVGQYESGGYITAEFLADAIRARGQQENG